MHVSHLPWRCRSPVQAINGNFSVTAGDYVRSAGPCHSCGRVTARTAFVGVPNETPAGTVADRQRKCVRSSRRVRQQQGSRTIDRVSP